MLLELSPQERLTVGPLAQKTPAQTLCALVALAARTSLHPTNLAPRSAKLSGRSLSKVLPKDVPAQFLPAPYVPLQKNALAS
ncbi:MAG: hypothetical protein LBU07_02120, partial [Coriobacteriales bacterium]|nr:hypothetical protein [Coriobacteriales bacterium]